MNEFDIKRLALIYAIQAEIEGMKIRNEIENQISGGFHYYEYDFSEKARELREIVEMKNDCTPKSLSIFGPP